jgi:hypothetical protein
MFKLLDVLLNILLDELLNILFDVLLNILLDELLNILFDVLLNILLDVLLNILLDVLEFCGDMFIFGPIDTLILVNSSKSFVNPIIVSMVILSIFSDLGKFSIFIYYYRSINNIFSRGKI